jgi:hypothetical protein
MHSSKSRRAASEVEIRSAIEGLANRELFSLRRFALKCMRINGVLQGGDEPHDLVSQAVFLTLKGARVWYPGRVDFRGHLLGTIRSLASHLAERLYRGSGECRSPTALETAREGGGLLADRPDHRASPDEACYAEQVLVQLAHALAGDPDLLGFARCVAIHGGGSAPGPAIQAALELTEKEYRALRARLKSALDRIFGGRYGQ